MLEIKGNWVWFFIFYNLKKWGSEKFSYLPKITQLFDVSDWYLGPLLLSWCFPLFWIAYQWSNPGSQRHSFVTAQWVHYAYCPDRANLLRRGNYNKEFNACRAGWTGNQSFIQSPWKLEDWGFLRITWQIGDQGVRSPDWSGWRWNHRELTSTFDTRLLKKKYHNTCYLFFPHHKGVYVSHQLYLPLTCL